MTGARSARRPPVIAIDGPTASGKSTVARAIARRLGLEYLDTGAMYRSVALVATQQGLDLNDAPAMTRLASTLRIESRPNGAGDRTLVDGRDVTEAIRAPEVSTAASVVSALPGVRAALVARQRERAASGGIVMEGRDIGTVVLPDADLKIFLEATLEARARRRHAELQARGVSISLEEVQRQEAERDRRDATRTHSPLRPARDAVVIDTTALTPDEVVGTILRLLRERMEAG
ncbi:MAG: (d)CMP kinase [Armatimonadota bacterium]|nr:(d)CMP kinase [Armatimonadota bacterium]